MRTTSTFAWLAGLLVLLTLRSGRGAVPSSSGRANPRTGRPIVDAGARPKLTADELRALVVSHHFADVEKAIAIATRESGRAPSISVDTRGMTPAELQAYWGFKAGTEYSVGLWQINLLANALLVPGGTIEEKAEALRDPEISAGVAHRLSAGGTNWAPWGG